MKTNRLLSVLFLLLISVTTIARDNISRDEALNIIKEKLSLEQNTSVEIFVCNSIVKQSSPIALLSKEIQSPNYDSWCFFIDDNPMANWAHPCRFLFVNPETGDLEIIKNNMPPASLKFKKINQAKNVEKNKLNIQELKALSSAAKEKVLRNNSSKNDYAVIISGGGNAFSNNVRYWNDCATIYSILINTYSYPKDHVFVLMADGTSPEYDRLLLDGTCDSSPLDLDGDGLPDIEYAATKENISNVFDKLGSTLSSYDNLFIYVTDHGSLINESSKSSQIVLWNKSAITDKEFAKEVNKVNAGKINICMEQCYSGGFIDDLSGMNRLIATACNYNELSYATSDRLYNEFVYHWSAAILGTYPSGRTADADTNQDGLISMQEAFDYARDNDRANEHPQCSFLPEGIGDNTFMAHSVLAIKGADYIYDTEEYYIEDLPSKYKVKWSLANPRQAPYPVLQQDSLSNKCTISNKYHYPYKDILRAFIYENNKLIDTLSRNIESLSSYYGTYEQEHCTYYGVSHPEIKSTKLQEDVAIFVHQGCTVRLSSSLFKYCYIYRHDGIVPDFINLNENGNLYFTLPLGSGGKPFNLYLKVKGSNKQFHFLFFTVSNNANIATSNKLLLTAGEQNLKIDIINTEQDGSDNTEWNVEVFNGNTGSKQEESVTDNGSLNMETSTWRKGLYVVRASSNDRVLSEKIILK